MKIKKIALKILMLSGSVLLIAGCGSQISDKILKTESYIVSESKVNNAMESPNSDLSGLYSGIEDMYGDSDYVVSGIVKDIEYFEVQPVLLRKINVLVNKSYKGNITKNTLISILENDGYYRLKSVYEAAKKAYEEKYGDKDKEKEEAWLYKETDGLDIKAAENDMLIRYSHLFKEDSKIGDELLLFLTDSSEDTYKDKKVKLALGKKLSYPKGAYAPLGLWMGKLTRVEDSYMRNRYYYTSEFTDKGLEMHQVKPVKEGYTVKEMEAELKKLK